MIVYEPLWNDLSFVGHDASIIVHRDKEDDGIVYIKSHGNRKKIEVDKVFGPEDTQKKVRKNNAEQCDHDQLDRAIILRQQCKTMFIHAYVAQWRS